MDRQAFCAYFEQHFFSSQAQDLIIARNEMKASLGDREFIKYLLTHQGCIEMYAFLNSELEKDNWEYLIEFFMENGIILMDVCGYYESFGVGSLEKLESIYRDLLDDIYKAVANGSIEIKVLQEILEKQSSRLIELLGDISLVI